MALTLAARATTRLGLGTGVTNPLTRHAAVTAGAIASLQEISDGRAMLGIGRGDSSLFNIGHKPVPPARLERFAVIGPAGHCIEKLTTLRDLGIDRVFVIGPQRDHFGAEADDAQRRFAQEVIPALRQRSRSSLWKRSWTAASRAG